MSRGSTGPIIQVDRLIFDTRDKTKKNSFIPGKNFIWIEFKSNNLDVSSSLPILHFSSNSSNKTNREEISTECYVSFPSNKLKIIRLTVDDLNQDEEKIYAMGQQSSKVTQIYWKLFLFIYLLLDNFSWYY